MLHTLTKLTRMWKSRTARFQCNNFSNWIYGTHTNDIIWVSSCNCLDRKELNILQLTWPIYGIINFHLSISYGCIFLLHVPIARLYSISHFSQLKLIICSSNPDVSPSPTTKILYCKHDLLFLLKTLLWSIEPTNTQKD